MFSLCAINLKVKKNKNIACHCTLSHYQRSFTEQSWSINFSDQGQFFKSFASDKSMYSVFVAKAPLLSQPHHLFQNLDRLFVKSWRGLRGSSRDPWAFAVLSLFASPTNKRTEYLIHFSRAWERLMRRTLAKVRHCSLPRISSGLVNFPQSHFYPREKRWIHYALWITVYDEPPSWEHIKCINA